MAAPLRRHCSTWRICSGSVGSLRPRWPAMSACWRCRPTAGVACSITALPWLVSAASCRPRLPSAEPSAFQVQILRPIYDLAPLADKGLPCCMTKLCCNFLIDPFYRIAASLSLSISMLQQTRIPLIQKSCWRFPLASRWPHGGHAKPGIIFKLLCYAHGRVLCGRLQRQGGRRN